MTTHRKSAAITIVPKFFPENSPKCIKAKSPTILPNHRSTQSYTIVDHILPRRGSLNCENVQKEQKHITQQNECQQNNNNNNLVNKNHHQTKSINLTIINHDQPKILLNNQQDNKILEETLKFLHKQEQNISTTDLESISIDQLLKWRNSLLETCSTLEQFQQEQEKDTHNHNYAFKIVPASKVIEKQINEEIQNRETLEMQTKQIMKLQEQEILQLQMKIKQLEMLLN